MDGVLIDSEPIHVEIEKKLFDRLGIFVDEAVHHSFMGASNEFMYTELKSRFKLEATLDELMEIDELFRCDYFKNIDVINLNDGVIALLDEIRLSGIKLAVATSSSPAIANILLEKCGITSYFNSIVTTNEAGKSKPAPDVYLLAAEKLGVATADCIAFEDSTNGLSAAKSAGMYCIAMPSDSAMISGFSKADFIIRTFTEVTFSRLLEIFTSIKPLKNGI